MEDLPLLRLVLLLQIIIISIILPLQPCPALGQQQMTDSVYGLCNTATFDTNSSFAHNLYSVLGNLAQRSSTSLYSNATVTSGSSNDSHVYAMYQCRGDLSFSECYTCASPLLGTNLCGPAIGMRVQLKGCYARYENYNFLAVDEDTLVTSNCSATQSTNSLYKANLATVLNATAKAAPAHAVFGFNASSVGKGGSTTAYALAQCVGYLSPSQCQSCLSQVSAYTTLCKDSVAGQAYFVTCFYLFDNAPLLFTTASTASPAPEAAPEASPPKPAQASIISPASGTSILDSPKSPSQVQSKTKNRSTVPIIVGIVLGVFLLLAVTAVLAGLCFARRRRRAKLAQQSKTTDAKAALPYNFQQGATKFSLEELREATDDFHPRNKLGQGGFGPVYKGTLKSGREVAIKSLSSESHQGKAEFMNEVNLITNVQHRNLIQLLGCCVEESDRLLVYEYLPNRSLDLLLFDVGHNDHGIGLDWHTRFNIIVGIARGLCYLREDSHVRIVHRDIKASNILLDNNLNPKIADFGLARFFADDVTHLTTKVAGTLGYLAPEYAINGQLTQKADVYSFGLVALEIVSGRKVIEHRLEAEKQHLLEWAWALYERQQQLQMVDEKLSNKGMVNAGEAIRVVHVALLCAQTSAQARPAMSQVYTMLCGQSEILELPTKPTIIGMESPYNQVPFTSSSTSSTWHSDPSQTAPTSNRISISEIDAR